MAMSWKVRRFLKQVRDQKDDECIKKTTTKKVTINDTPKLTVDDDSRTPPAVHIDHEAESNNVISISADNLEIIHECGFVSNSISSLQTLSSPLSMNGKYVNWTSQHTELATQPWCCVGDLISFCDRYEYKTLSLNDTRSHNKIVTEVKALLTVGQAPFDLRRRFPGSIHNPENLWVCISRCTSVEYHLKKILNIFRKPLVQIPVDKQRVARQNFHLAVNELRLDISARISAVKLYDRNIFESEFNLHWQNTTE